MNNTITTKSIKWNIEINQRAIIENGININYVEAGIFNFIADFISYGSKINKKTIDDNVYCWVSYQYIIDSLPLLRIKNKEVIARHVKNIIKEGLLESYYEKLEAKTYFKIGEKASSLFFGEVFNSSSNEGGSTEKSNNSYINNTNINTIQAVR